MISCPVASAVRNGDASRFSRASISARFASGSSASSISRRYAADAPPSMCIDPQRADGQANRWNIPVGRCWHCPATPNSRPITTVHHGIRLSQVAITSRAPARSIPCFSDSSPTMKPGSSANEISGRWNVSHSWISRITLSPPATSVEPPACIGLFAITPTG